MGIVQGFRGAHQNRVFIAFLPKYPILELGTGGVLFSRHQGGNPTPPCIINGKKLNALFDLQRLCQLFQQQVEEFGLLSFDIEKIWNTPEIVYVILCSPRLWTIVFDIRSLKREKNVTSDVWHLALPSSLIKMLQDKEILVVGVGIKVDAQLMLEQGISIHPIYDMGQMYQANEERWLGKQSHPGRTALKWIANRFYGASYKPHISKRSFIEFFDASTFGRRGWPFGLCGRDEWPKWMQSRWFYQWTEPITPRHWHYMYSDGMMPFSVLFR